MLRRDFLKGGTLATLGMSLHRAEAATRGPTVISTWSFGLDANRVAYPLLAGGGSPLDAAQRGVMVTEGDPDVTSVGYGGLPNRDGAVELDAAIMNGSNLEVGSVAGLRDIMHPVAVARKVMDETPHVMLVGRGARAFALRNGFRKERLLTPEARKRWKAGERPEGVDDHDTIGMVVLDAHGKMAAAATTSGMAFKLPGRIGDTPVVGHGLYCDDEAGGAVATGVGEEVAKVCGCYQVVEFMRQGRSPEEAIRQVLDRILRRDPANREQMIGFAALRSDGAIGFASTIPGFEVAVSREGSHEVLVASSVLQG